ncbi:MAG: EpsI family protein [Acidobacteriia bacterium]|nr:EpsI family protein [Terriglobia bacterium]
MTFLHNKFTRVLTLVLVLQAVLLYAAISRAELVPSMTPLARFPKVISGWHSIEDVPIEPEILEVLKADETLNRVYLGPDGTRADLFVAFFKTQREGQSPHSPKNCLPGNGWEPLETGLVSIAAPGRAQPITVNRYVAAHGDQKAVVIYWYQSHDRVIASEYSAKFWLVADSVRYHRSDTTLVKVVVPVDNGRTGAAVNAAVTFVQVTFPALVQQLPR